MLPTEDYIYGVVAAEMPVSFEAEALKAQAVAARSYMYARLHSGRHNGKLCTDSGCCQAYADEKQLAARWGAAYPFLSTKIKKAVNGTAGEYLSYGGAAAEAVFHASSYRRTEDSGALWNPLPYLVSVDTPETEESVPGLISTVIFSEEEFRERLEEVCPEAVFPEDAGEWIKSITKNESGRTEQVQVAGISLSGTQLRSLFSLRSTAFELRHEEGGFVLTVFGHGHGIGMSQYGANLMAENGAGYASILAHYYPGTELTVFH